MNSLCILTQTHPWINESEWEENVCMEGGKKQHILNHPLSGVDVMAIFLPLSNAAKGNLDVSDSASSRSLQIKH